jgi:hypothetical protein
VQLASQLVLPLVHGHTTSTWRNNSKEDYEMDFKKMLVGVATTAVGFAFGYWAYNKFLKTKPTTSPAAAAVAAASKAMEQSPLQGV